MMHGSTTDSDPHPQTLYVADRQLNLVEVNEHWADFARGNRGEALLAKQQPPNLLDSMSGSTRARWQSIYELLLSGQISSHEERFNCSSPTQRRNYRLRITPQVDASGQVERLVHQTVPVDDSEGVERRARDLERLSADPEATRRGYRRRVIERTVELMSFDTCGYVRPLGETGGDVLWHRGYVDGPVDLVIADAMGHGESAAVLATQLSYLLDEVAKPDHGPGQIVAALNAAMASLIRQEGSGFATGLLLRLDSRRRRMTACSFGHEGPLFSRTGQVAIDHGPPVGLTADLGGWPEKTLEFAEHGRRFVLFTDGITEQFNPDGDMLTVRGLERLFRQNLDMPLEQMVQRINEAIEEFRSEAIIKDDQTLLALECSRDS